MGESERMHVQATAVLVWSFFHQRGTPWVYRPSVSSNTLFITLIKPCVLPSLGSNPGASQPDVEKLGLYDLATDQTYVNFRKKCSYGN